ncbi:unnamed protein product [Effrenium voratum]|uniref:Uncharacterized protein n=1 Tax=Effrenium voratum TaxID=2562239 RepID=A0AA36J790_9DINO|nr:unnamed protein product [Effrenium voratum]CAJ1453414.1 unnamed protein product [Effrenium voratum]
MTSASSLRQKASPFLSKARQAIVEEAKLLSEDAKDIAGGVREGMQLTRQDLKASTKGWRSALGAKLRREPSPEAAASASAQSEDRPSGLEAMKQNLANTARDVSELRQEVMNEVRLSVSDLRQVTQQVWRGSDAADGEESPKESKGLDKVKAVFRKAGDLRRKEPFWLLPSTQANYVQLQRGESKAEKVRSLGGKLKGSLAKKSREVSSNVASFAQDIRQKREAWKEKGDQHEEEPSDLGDSIFAIGSDEEWDSETEGSTDANTAPSKGGRVQSEEEATELS